MIPLQEQNLHLQEKTPPTPVQKMTPVESKPTAKPVETFKPKTPTEKKGIDAALDGLE